MRSSALENTLDFAAAHAGARESGSEPDARSVPARVRRRARRSSIAWSCRRQVSTYATDATPAQRARQRASVRASGGLVTATVGGEWRKESVQFDSALGSFEREVGAGFAELTIPVFGADMHVPALRELKLTAGGRLDHYSDFGQIFNPQFGLQWLPYQDLSLHASYGRSFRAPSMYELHSAASGVSAAVSRCRSAPGCDNHSGLDHRRQSGAGADAGRILHGGLRVHAASARTGRAVRNVLARLHGQPHHVPAAAARADERDAVSRARHPCRADARRLGGRPSGQHPADRRVAHELRSADHQRHRPRRALSSSRAGSVSSPATWSRPGSTSTRRSMCRRRRLQTASTSPTRRRHDHEVARVAGLDWDRGALGATMHVRYIPSYDDTRERRAQRPSTLPAQTFLDLQTRNRSRTTGSPGARCCAVSSWRPARRICSTSSRTLRKSPASRATTRPKATSKGASGTCGSARLSDSESIDELRAHDVDVGMLVPIEQRRMPQTLPASWSSGTVSLNRCA